MRPAEAVVSLLRQLAEQLSLVIVLTALAGSDPARGLHKNCTNVYANIQISYNNTAPVHDTTV